MAVPLLAVALGGLAASLINQIPPGGEWISQTTFSFMPNRVPNIAEAILLRYRNIISKSDYDVICKRNGFSSEISQNMFDSQVKLLNETDLISAWRRGIITEDKLEKDLSKLQYTAEDIENIKKVSEYYPSPSDLVRFAVREVYSPEIVKTYGLTEDFPQEFLDAAYKAGLTEEQAKNYWAAHWELPSILQGFEMLHRGVITQDELNTLLRTHDVMPYWREKLTQISYNPLTRVDVRRMYALGVLDRAGVKKSYLDIGYSEENAELMTDFTIKYESNEDAGLTRSSITSAYKKGLITGEQFTEYLQRLGYADETIQFYAELTDFEIYNEEMDSLVESITQQVDLGVYTIEEANIMLTSLDLPSVYVSTIVNKLKLKQTVKAKIPSKSDVENWLKLNIINEKTYSDYMVKQGYSESDIVKYLEEINIEVDTSKIKYQPVKTYQRWLTLGIMSEDAFKLTLKEMLVSNTDIERYIAEYKKSLQEEG